jgi:hypothetical protein
LYSTSNRKGRPKGTKNKRTLDRPDEKRAESHSNSTPRDIPEIFDASNELNNQESVRSFNDIDSTMGEVMMDDNYFQIPNTIDDFDSSIWDLATYEFLGGNSFLQPQDHPDSDNISVRRNTPSRELQVVEAERVSQSFPTCASNSTTITSSPTVATTCSCFNDHAELLCRLKELDQRNTRPTLDIILVGVQHCLNPWKGLINCRVCRRNEDQEVLLLSALTLRLVLRRLLDFCASQRNEESNTTIINTDQMVDAPGSETSCTVGMYELRGDEKALMMDTLLWYTLRRVKCAMITLQERLCYLRANAKGTAGVSSDEFRGRGMDYDSDVGHIQQMVCGFEEKLRNLEGIFQGTGSARWQMISWSSEPLVSQ